MLQLRCDMVCALMVVHSWLSCSAQASPKPHAPYRCASSPTAHHSTLSPDLGPSVPPFGDVPAFPSPSDPISAKAAFLGIGLGMAPVGGPVSRLAAPLSVQVVSDNLGDFDEDEIR